MDIRRFLPGDEGALSALIRRTLREVNTADPPEEGAYLFAKYTPETVAALAREGHSYVVCEGETPVGCGTLLPLPGGECEIVAAFLAPEAIGKGYGRALFTALERDALFTAAPRVTLTSSVMAQGFYEHLGYRYTCGYRQRNAEGLIELEKVNR